jgi:phosphate transport system substrate-binding protein
MLVRLRTIGGRLAALALLLGALTALPIDGRAARPAAAVGVQSPPDLAVIVHPDVAVDNLTLAELRRILLGDREFWSTGVRVSLLIRAPVARERDVVVKDICQMTEAQFRQHWIGKVFRNETSSGPRIVYSSQMALDQVSRTPGAISFVEAPLAGKSVKILRIDGRSPGQQGYRLR